MPVLETWADLEYEIARVSGWDWRRQVRYQMVAYRLTPRERDVVWLLFEGLINKEIGNRLFLSTDTVRNHLTSVYRKTDAPSREVVILRMLGILES